MALAATVGLVTYMATPALGHGTGATVGGSSNIHADQFPPPPTGLCIQSTNQPLTITLINEGTFNDSTTPVEHRAHFQADDSFWFGPGGTYSDSTCTTLAAVEGTLKVHGGPDQVSCTETTATYERVGSDYTITTTGTTTCTIGNGSPHTTNDLTYTGTQLACDVNTDCGSGVHSVEFTGEYSQT